MAIGYLVIWHSKSCGRWGVRHCHSSSALRFVRHMKRHADLIYIVDLLAERLLLGDGSVVLTI